MQLSIVIPVYNEEQVISSLAVALKKVAPLLPKKTELILVDDGSSDQTLQKIQKTKWPWPVQVLEFSRNFGHQAALLAGLRVASGQMVVTLDGDLQHPPSLIPKMIALCKKGYDVVLTQRIDRKDRVSFFKRFTSQLFYLSIHVLSDTSIPLNASDFRLMNRAALNELLAMPENRKFLRGMVNWIGFDSVLIPFEVGERQAGKSKYSLMKMLKLAFHGLTSFSVVPLYFSGVFSLVLFAAAFFYALYVLYVRFFTNSVVSGWASVLLVLLILGGFITFFLGLLGFYLAAVYEEVKARPPYIVKSMHSVKKKILKVL